MAGTKVAYDLLNGRTHAHTHNPDEMNMTKKQYSTARKVSKTPTRNFVYGVGNKGEQPFPKDIIQDQLWKAHDYKATVLWNHCLRVDEETAILCEVEPRLTELDQQAKELSAEIKTMRTELNIPKGCRDDSPESAAIKALTIQRSSIYEEMSTLRKAAFKTIEGPQKEFDEALGQALLKMAAERDPSFAPLLDGCPKDEDPDEFKKKVTRAINTIGPRNPERVALVKRMTDEMLSSDAVPDLMKRLKEVERRCHEKNTLARNNSGCFSGTYQAVDSAVKDAIRKSYRPRIPKYEHTGKIGIQLTKGINTKGEVVKGLPVSSVFDTRQKFSLELLPNHKVYGAAGKKIKVMARARIRVKRNVCVEALVVLHRPLPEDGLIKWAYLEVKKDGLRTRYELRLVIEFTPQPKPRTNSKLPLLAINLGYRSMDDGTIRLATTWDGENIGGITLPAHIKEDEDLSRRLESYAGKHFTYVKKELSKWKGKNKKDLPEDLKDFLQFSGQWRAHGKLAKATRMMVNAFVPEARETIKRLWHEWRVERLSTGEGVFRVPRKGSCRKDWEKEDLFDSWPFLEAWFQKHGVRSRDARFALYLEWWRIKDDHLIGLSKHLRTRYKLRIREIIRMQVARWRESYEVVASNEWDMRKTAKKPKPENDTRTHQEKAANSVRQISGPGAVTASLKESFKGRLIKTNSKDISKTHFGCNGEGVGVDVDRYCGKCGRTYDQDVNAVLHTWKAANEVLNGPSDPSEDKPQKGPAKRSKRRSNLET